MNNGSIRTDIAIYDKCLHNLYMIYEYHEHVIFLILANLYLPYFFWGVPSAACLPFVSPLLKICALSINVSRVVHRNHFGPETRGEQMMLDYYYYLIILLYSMLDDLMFSPQSSGECHLLSLIPVHCCKAM